jgi:hypothetical protein
MKPPKMDVDTFQFWQFASTLRRAGYLSHARRGLHGPAMSEAAIALAWHFGPMHDGSPGTASLT